MKNGLLSFTLVSVLLSSPFSFADEESASGQIIKECGKQPVQPEVPNGRQASKEDMLAAQRAMKAFLEEGNTFMECLGKLERSLGDDATDEQKATIVIFHNKTVDDQQAIADLFNAAVRAFNGKEGS